MCNNNWTINHYNKNLVRGNFRGSHQNFRGNHGSHYQSRIYRGHPPMQNNFNHKQGRPYRGHFMQTPNRFNSTYSRSYHGSNLGGNQKGEYNKSYNCEYEHNSQAFSIHN
ncbi:unnamed protein product [Diatraea saccharalis]|uniref:Uncharacterized protein n=1 Tax=Diatraea saccharalis TaxID=40085 RepID=A0A9N9WEH1_9NEOP|nr:unnamed protein product [Diatraea saccharalis]